MQYITFSDNLGSSFPICLYAKQLRRADLNKEFVTPLVNLGLKRDKVIAYENPCYKKKADRMEHYAVLLTTLSKLGTKYLMVSDSQTMKDLTDYGGKVDGLYGYVLPITHECGNGIQAVYTPAASVLFHHPEYRTRIQQGVQAVFDHATGNYKDPGSSIIHHAEYPTEYNDIKAALEKLLKMDKPLACDIEAFSLRHVKAGIGTIAFAWSKHEGIAFPVDYAPIGIQAPYGEYRHNEPVRALLREFFIKNSNKLRLHNISYDFYVLIYQLFMTSLTDTEGLLRGLKIMFQNWDDTMLITYLATNSCAGNQLGLKPNSQEFSGNYATDVKDICQVPLPQLLEYNLVDALSTNYVYERHYPTMVADDQVHIYETLFKPAIIDIVQMQLTGMPIDLEAVAAGKAIMEKDRQDAIDKVQTNPIMVTHMINRAHAWVQKRNSELKKKRVSLADYTEEFNIGSGKQLVSLLYDELQLPIIDRSKSGGPATKRSTLKKLIKHTKDANIIALLEAMIDFKSVEKILSAFIPAFEAAVLGPDGQHYLFGFFNLGGTLSGRLSSSNVNLQQLPATGSKYAKLVKAMFKAPPGWLFVGLDFDSLEDRISALTTKDPFKLKVYTDGYDGHSLRAYYYFQDQMPDIDPNSVESINSIAKKYEALRQLSKAPTFALTYQGTYITLMRNCGFDEQTAKSIEANYHTLYAVSDKWVADRIAEACQRGYVLGAFGLRVRTPLLKQCVLGARSTPYEAAAEGRTAGNALGQSYCMLNMRAMSELMTKVRSSIYRFLIRPCAQIHDAQYYLVKNDLALLSWLNREIVKAVQWQELPEIQHDEVKLSGSLGIFYPNWSKELTIPHGASPEQIRQLSIKHLEKLNEPGK